MPRVVSVVSSVGYHWEEVYAAWDEFERAGWKTRFSIIAGRSTPDPVSVKKTFVRSWFGYGISKQIAPDTPRGQELATRLNEAQPLSQLRAEEIDVLYLPGGHGCLFDMNRSAQLHAVIREVHTRGGILAAVCHATSTFALAGVAQGRRLTGFPNVLDAVLVSVGGVHSAFLPIPFSNDATLRDGGVRLGWLARFWAAMNPRYVRVDPPFVTGVGPKAARSVARECVALLRERLKMGATA